MQQVQTNQTTSTDRIIQNSFSGEWDWSEILCEQAGISVRADFILQRHLNHI